MGSFNQVVLVGNMTRDPELRYTGGGTAVCEFSLAVNERVKKGDQWVDEVNYFDVVYFGKRAETVNQYLGKGSQLLVSGRLKHERWEKDGKKNSRVKVVGNELTMLGGNRKSGGQRASDNYAPEEEVPF